MRLTIAVYSKTARQSIVNRFAWGKSGAEADEPEFLHVGRSLHRLVLNLQDVMAHKTSGIIGAVKIGQLRKSEKNLDKRV